MPRKNSSSKKTLKKTQKVKPVEPVKQVQQVEELEKTSTKVTPVAVSREVLYVGTADNANRLGKSGERYSFIRDRFLMPLPTLVKEEDISDLLAETGLGCFRRDPEKLFVLKADWDKETERLAKSNSK